MLKIYTKNNCIQCLATKKYCERTTIEYEEIPVTVSIREELLEEGFTGVPVVKTDSETWVGYRPDHLQKYIPLD